MSPSIKELKRVLELKEHLLALLHNEISEIKTKIAFAELEQDERPCHIWDLTGGMNVPTRT